jgi:transcriptional regulator with XRE-family HTH domain
MGNLANRLAKKLRELRGETPQIHFARRLGISKSSLNRMELGHQNVSLKSLERLCARLRCDVADLFPKERA